MGIVLLTVGAALLLIRANYVFILLFIAIIYAEGLRPLVDLLNTRLRLPRPLAVFTLYLAILMIVLGLGWLMVQPLVQQVSSLTAALPGVERQLHALTTRIQHLAGSNAQIAAALNGIQGQLGGLFTKIVPLLLSVPLLLGQLIFSAVVIAVMAFFWLTGIERLKPFIISLFPPRTQPTVDDVLHVLSERVGSYLRGVVVNMFVIGILSGLGNWVLGVPYPLLLGIIAGLTELLPYIGPWISGGAAVLVALLLLGPLKAVEIVALYLAIQEIEGNTLVPVVMMRTVKLNPLTVVVAVLLGTEVLGIVGGVLAVPAAAIVEVLVLRVLAPVARQHAAARVTVARGSVDADRPPSPPLPT